MGQSAIFNKLQGHGRAIRHGFRQIGETPVEARRAGHDVYQSARWQKLSAQLRRDNPYCSQCLVTSRQEPRLLVDHVQEIRDAPHLAYDLANLVVLCYSCHAAKTARAKTVRQWSGTQAKIARQLAEYERADTSAPASTGKEGIGGGSNGGGGGAGTGDG